MKTIIAGGRDIDNEILFLKALKQVPFEITEVICGMARGVDTMGLHYGERVGLPVHKFPADWERNGKAAGPMRNVEMLKVAEALFAMWTGWEGNSKGTRHTIEISIKAGIPVAAYNIKTREMQFYNLERELF